MQKYVIIVAGGSGTRMKSQYPKQFLPLHDKPILMHTISAFDFDNIKIIVVLPQEQIPFWKELCQKNAFFIPHSIVAGGESRFHSVKNGLEHVAGEDGLVAIHDGVRPMITKKIINASFAAANTHGNAIVSVPLKDSIREVSEDKNQHRDRSKFRLIQTPQTFQLQLIKEAFNSANHANFTDDASVLEAYGEEIHLIDGDYKNIKITTPEDVLIAETYLEA